MGQDKAPESNIAGTAAAERVNLSDFITNAIHDRVYRDRPSSIFRPNLTREQTTSGLQWVAWYGSSQYDGVIGRGSSPAEAMADFDRAWESNETVPPTPTEVMKKLFDPPAK